MLHNRHTEILLLLANERMVKAKDLVDRFGVSMETIRRDLDHLARNGFITRVHGGAVVKQMSGREPDYALREIRNHPEKRAVAALAAELVEDGNTLAIDIGTTCLEFARLLKARRNLTVITNSLPITLELADEQSLRVILLGGNVRGGDYATSGFLPEEAMRHFTVDTYFLGVGGITPEAGITDYMVEESNLRRHVLAHSQTTVALADHSKFGVVAMNRICPVAAIGTLVTDRGADKIMLGKIREAGVRVLVAEP